MELARQFLRAGAGDARIRRQQGAQRVDPEGHDERAGYCLDALGRGPTDDEGEARDVTTSRTAGAWRAST
jgi:hypothetical protein